MWPKRLLFWAAWTGMIAIGSVAAPAATADDELKWEPTLESAQRLARKSHRLVLIHFGGPWCPPCQRMEQEVFSKPGFGREISASYVAVKIDPQRDPAAAKKYGVLKVPSDVIVTASGQPVYKFSPSPTTAAEYVKAMKGLALQEQPLADMLAGGPVAKSPSAPLPETPSPNSPPSDIAQPEKAANAKSATATSTGSGPLLSPSGPTADATLAGQRQPSPMHQTAASSGAEAAAGESPRPAAKKMPIALDGFCPVTLITRQKWQAGDRRWGAYHRGHLYLFAGETEQKAFLAAPDDYTPAFNGLDPVLAVDHNQKVAGKREFGAFYPRRHGRVYLFSSDETYHKFERDVARYSGETRQARRGTSITAGTSTAQNPPRAR